MKHLNKLLVAVMMVMGLSSHAQDSNNPWAISFGVNAVDTRTSSGAGSGFFDQHFSQPFAVKDNWNILPSLSYIGVSRYVGSGFSVGLQGSVNKIDKYVTFDPSNPAHDNRGNVVSNPGDLMYYGIDATIKYSFQELIKSKVIDPSLSVGGGYTFFGDSSYGTVNPGAGLTFWFTDAIGLELATRYKWSVSGDRQDASGTPDAPSHFQHTAGLVFKFGGKDTDGDGIYDKDDACPDVAGLKQFNGCPDTDGDGIVDASDACPTEFGLAALNGCPDRDGDGIADKDDACPDTPGLKQFNGCPDTDGDGVPDKDDKCPTVAGPKENGGCPFLDADKDGVADKDDDCPTVYGPASNRGCPEVTTEALEDLKVQARAVYFNSGKATFKTGDKETPARLDAIKEILKNYPNAKFSIEGHTDSTGSAKINDKLSQDRANAVMNALIERGVNPENLVAKGFGSSQPVASNKTAAGKAQNRRTEIRHIGSKYQGKI
ncbi:Peptidoglycan-associated lipoprotein [Flavobacterium bizetiae]|uniref:Peptidoglycan-associated lipoprotein n=1 Tax=Flavobacterium bizetiae TaxID=2704140 RepID=A0A6J4GF89_9FLAO|nr:OmpA family protein [Flavobacterium bizetiae]CAA9197869.1 Peptidoglycan-associated lipoprotein [Flavobacterium bizetiae]CAD5341815.1 Peptidoglycan-associated lipoprotein [Flavobacterium bizetiae]CAD5347563.1 Peptidoglycan-associated lipoprotein [Flavobacterium bizetiae]